MTPGTEPTQVCRTCDATLPLAAFAVRADTGKHRTECDVCRKAYHRAHRAANRDRKREQDRRYYQANRAAELLKRKAWREAHPGYDVAHGRKWAAEHPGYHAAQSAQYRAANLDRLRAYDLERQKLKDPAKRNELVQRRRARIRGSQVEPVSLATILRRDGRWCYICELPILPTEELHFDHVVPVVRKGAHSEANIRPAHAVCNVWKQHRLLEELDLAAWRALRRSL